VRLNGARVLDLYAGSGAVGLEAVSRGAASAVLVEPDADGLTLALERWGVGESEVRVLAEPAARAIARLAAADARFDVVFADPPYARDAAERDLAALAALLAPGAVVVVQTDAGTGAPSLPGLAPTARRAYGRNVFHFLGVL
jgi:16S rRNA (guanine966-N2)-methyltransferase